MKFPTSRRWQIGLVSCVASKTTHAAPAAELYTSPLFRNARTYVQNHCDQWFILSAKYGLLSPDKTVAPYEQTLLKMKKDDRRAWTAGVLSALEKTLKSGDEVLVLAGARYREFVQPWLVERGHRVAVPMKSLPIGRQLQWLKEHN